MLKLKNSFLLVLLFVFVSCGQQDYHNSTPSPDRSFEDALKSAQKAVENRDDRFFFVSAGGGSMLPWFKGNAIIIMQNATEEEVNVGDVVQFFGRDNRENSFIPGYVTIHQLISKNPLKTKGLGNKEPDDWLDIEEIQGRMIGIRYFNPSTAPKNPQRFNSR